MDKPFLICHSRAGGNPEKVVKTGFLQKQESK